MAVLALHIEQDAIDHHRGIGMIILEIAQHALGLGGLHARTVREIGQQRNGRGIAPVRARR